jgi:hypothetical protein
VEVCVAKANLLRCVLCFLFPFVALAAYAAKAASVGTHDVQSYLSAVANSSQNAASALLFFGGSLAWVLVTWPKALAALRSGDCAISVGQHRLWIYGETVERSRIAGVEVVRRLLDVQLCVRRKDGSEFSRSITLLSPKPDALLAALREQGL